MTPQEARDAVAMTASNVTALIAAAKTGDAYTMMSAIGTVALSATQFKRTASAAGAGAATLAICNGLKTGDMLTTCNGAALGLVSLYRFIATLSRNQR